TVRDQFVVGSLHGDGCSSFDATLIKHAAPPKTCTDDFHSSSSLVTPFCITAENPWPLGSARSPGISPDRCPLAERDTSIGASRSRTPGLPGSGRAGARARAGGKGAAPVHLR